MSEVGVDTEGGGAPLPPKRPTIIRPVQDGRGPVVPARPAPARPAPPPPGARPPPAVPRPPAAGSTGPPPPAAAPPRPSGPSPTPDGPTLAPAKRPDPPAKDTSRPRSQGSVRKRPEITIIDARPMSQAGFRDMRAAEAAAVAKPANTATRDADSTPKPSNNGVLPAVPSRPAPVTATKTSSTPPPSQPPPPIPPLRPGAPHSPPHSHPEVPSPLNSKPETGSSDAPSRPTRPTILRPSRPRSVVMATENSLEESQTCPPPPLPKRSPFMADVVATGDLINLNPPPKPVRTSHSNGGSQGEDKADEDSDKGEGHVTPKKPTRVSIIRPARQPKPPAEDGQRDAEITDEPQEALSQHPPRPKPPNAPSRPVAVVAASPRDSSPIDAPRSVDAEHTRPSPPPVPVARPRSSPRDQPQDESTELKTQPSESLVESKPQGLPDRPKPPVPTSRPHAPPAVSPSGASPRLPEPAAPPKPPPPPAAAAAAASPPVPSSHPSRPAGGGGGGLPPPLIPSKPPPPLGAAQAGKASLYAVSDPLEEGIDNKLPVSLEPQLSRPPPPVPKTRPQSAHPPSPMVGRPLPSVPSQSSGDSPTSEQSHLYEDVDTARAQAHTLAELSRADSDQTDKLKISPRERNPAVAASATEAEDDVAGMYAKVNKPSKHNSSQSSVTNSSKSESVVANPFGVKLKHVPPESSPASENLPSPRNTETENGEIKRPPVLAPKPKPGTLPKPQLPAKPQSPGTQEMQAEAAAAIPPETSAKPDPPEPTKPQPTAKRPTIIRPSRPTPKSGDDSQTIEREDGSVNVQLREKATSSHPRPQSELGEESKTPAAEPPVPSKRPVTIIGFPGNRRKPPEPEAGEEAENTSPPAPRQRHALSEASPRNERSEVDTSLSAGGSASPPAGSERVGAPPPVTRPPPPRPDNKPAKPQQGGPSPPPEPPAKQKMDSDSAPPRPPSPAPPRPANKPAPPKEAAAPDGSTEVQGASVLPSTPRFAPPIKRKGSLEEEGVKSHPAGPSGPPARPVSMPPVKPPLSAAPKSPSAATGGKSEKPSRPQPVRPTAPKEVRPRSPPPLPRRPGLSHPLYSYMAGVPHAIALHDYPALQHDELPFQEGDTVVLLHRVDDQWLMGKVGDKEGLFPQNFVNIIHPLHDELPSSAIDDMIDGVFEDALQEKPDLLQGPRCRARFDFEGEGQGDLAFEDGDVIQLLAHCGDDWLKGELNGKVGIFPASFVEIIEDLPEDKEGPQTPRGTGSEVTALFDFSGEAGELSFQAGDRICILGKVDEQWLFGQCGGNQGSFPASFVDTVPLDLPFYDPATASQGSSEVAQLSQQRKTSEDTSDEPKRFCTAVYSFEKTQEGDLEFQEGDHIEIVEEVGQDWLRGRLAGREGIFPATFVQLDMAGAAPFQAVDPDEFHSTGLPLHSGLVLGKALFDFDGQADNELTFKAGDEIVLGSMVSEGSDWQWGELHGQKGMFPANFVEML